MATSLEDLPNENEMMEEPDLQELDEIKQLQARDYVPEDTTNQYRKRVTFNDELDFEPDNRYSEQLTIMEQVIETVRDPLLVFVVIFIFTNPTFIKMIMTIPKMKSYQGTTSFNIGIAVVATLVYYLFKKFVIN